MATFDVIRRGGDLPPWWSLASVAIGAVVFLVFAWTLLTDFVNPRPPADPNAGALPAATSSPDVTTPSDPDVTDSSPADPDTTSGPAGDGATLKVPTTSGGKVAIPVAAFSVAKDALEGLYDPAKAAGVPVAGAAEFPVPAAASPEAAFAALQVSRASDSDVTFVGVADPDGAGVQPQSFHTIAVTLGPSGWAWTASGS